ncbi:MAG: four helix bundle protein [Acidobacteriota bacterium]
MPRIQSFEDLEAWKIARRSVQEIYAITRHGAFSRDFGLRDQICRSAVSVMANVAEGFERDGDKEFINFLSIAKGSAGETRSLLYVAMDQNYITRAQFDLISARLRECSRVISGLLTYLRRSELKGLKFK